jgi:hypothetical protein
MGQRGIGSGVAAPAAGGRSRGSLRPPRSVRKEKSPTANAAKRRSAGQGFAMCLGFVGTIPTHQVCQQVTRYNPRPATAAIGCRCCFRWFRESAVAGALERVNQCSQQSDRRTPFCNPTPPPAELEVDRRWVGRMPLSGTKKKPRRSGAGWSSCFDATPRYRDRSAFIFWTSPP